MRLWQLLAFISGSIITLVMALASISYNATLGTTELAFVHLPISNTGLFSGLALAFDLGMIASVFGFLHWRRTRRIAAFLCIILFTISSLYSIHSVRGYIALNITKSLAPEIRANDLYASLKLELIHKQNYLAELHTKLLTTRARTRTKREITAIETAITKTRTQLSEVPIGHHVSPLSGLEWFLAATLWFFNASCWFAWFGNRTRITVTGDSVSQWLTTQDKATTEHCRELYDRYDKWCKRRGASALPAYSFYARLIELGATKFREGGKGATMYCLP